MDIYKIWKEVGLQGEEIFSDIEQDLKSRAMIERSYGADKRQEIYEKYINELKEKLTQ